MSDCIVEWDDAEKASVLQYLTDRSRLRGASTSAFKTDVFDGKKIEYSGDIFEDEAGYKWPDYLAYYVDVYDVALPDEFVKHVLETMH